MLAHQREIVSKPRSGVSELRLMRATKHRSMKVDALATDPIQFFIVNLSFSLSSNFISVQPT